MNFNLTKMSLIMRTTTSLRFISLCTFLLLGGVCLSAGLQFTKSLSAQEAAHTAASSIQSQPKTTQEQDGHSLTASALQAGHQDSRFPMEAIDAHFHETSSRELAFLILQHNGVTETEDKDKAMLGVHVRKADETLRKQLQVKGDFGLVIDHVTVDSAASRNLEQHDLLYRFDEQLLVNQEQLQALVNSKKPGDKIAIEFFRDGQLNKANVELAPRKHSSLSATMKDIESYHQPLMKDFSHEEAVKLLNCKDCHESATNAPAAVDLWRAAAPKPVSGDIKSGDVKPSGN